jgi:hypothetical protein
LAEIRKKIHENFVFPKVFAKICRDKTRANTGGTMKKTAVLPKIYLFLRNFIKLHEISHYREKDIFISTLEEVDPTTKMVATVSVRPQGKGVNTRG